VKNPETKFEEAWTEYLKKVGPEDPPEWWTEQLAADVPSGDLTKFIKKWVWKQPPADRGRILEVFAFAGHVEVASFIDELDRSEDALARDMAKAAREALEKFLAS
jgi:hypothetical protein